jgi:phage gp46-like protein
LTDIALSWSNALWRGDWRLNEEGLLADDADLGTAVMLSLYSDSRLPGDTIPDQGPVRGWWADTYRTFPLGSRLWLLHCEKKTEIVRRRAEEYAREAMQWFITAGVARRVDCKASWLPHPDATGFLEIEITIYPPEGPRRVWRYPYAWGQITGADR